MDINQPWMRQCARMCRLAKHLGEELHWASRQNHAGSVAAHSVVLDAAFVAIPGLSFQGEVQHRDYGPYQKYGLLYRDGGKALLVLTFEVYPLHVRSHTSPDGDIYGPHVHLGDERGVAESQAVRQLKTNIDPRAINGWIERFRRHARLRDNGDARLTTPFSDDLFA